MGNTALRLAFLLLLLVGASSMLRESSRLPGLVRPAGGITALVGATVIDGTGAAPVANCTVLIEGERIQAVGADVVLPDGANVVDLAGHTLVPGLIDVHGHLYANLGRVMKTLLRPFARLYLAGGVTTVFSPGDHDPDAALRFRDAQRAGKEVGTRIYCAGPYFNHASAEDDGMLDLVDAESARAQFREWRDRIDGVKVYTDITPEEFTAIVAEAKQAGLRVTGHLGSLTASRAIDLGIDRLEHGIFAMSEFGRPDPASPFALEFLYGLAEIDFESGVGADLIDKIIDKGIVLDPTIVILEALFAGPLELAEDWQRYLSPQTKQRLTLMQDALAGMRRGALADPEQWNQLVTGILDKQRELVRRVHQRGGMVVGGTDPVFVDALPGYGMQREAEHFVLAGMSALEAIRACTLDAAIALGLEQDLGSIAAGKFADLIVLADDPSQDIRALGSTRMIYQAGALFSPEELRESVVGTIE